MQIILKTTKDDDQVIDGFAAATGWRAGQPQTKPEWLASKISEFVSQRAKQGISTATATVPRTTYITAVKLAIADADTKVIPPTVTVEASAVDILVP